MRINPKKPLMHVKGLMRDLKSYLNNPETDLRYILGVVGLFCIVGWYAMQGELANAVVLLVVVIVMTLSFTIFGYLGVLVVNVIRKEQFNRKLALKAAILTLILVAILVVFDAPLDLALPVIAVMALRAIFTIVSALVARK